MKKTSRRSFGKRLAGAAMTLPLTAFAGRTVPGKDADERPAVVSNRNEHDTPPPVILMAGSWIFEARTEKDHDWSTTKPTTVGGKDAFYHTLPAYDNSGSPATGSIHIAHIKIVDGSGEMLCRLDNDDKDDITITTFMSNDKKEYVTLKADQKNFRLTFFEKRKLEKEDPSMDPENDKKKKRQRSTYKDDGGNDGKIYRIEISSDKAGTLYGLKVDGHKGEKELRVMAWWEA